MGPSVEYPPATPPSCASWTRIDEDDANVDRRPQSSPAQISQPRTIVAERAAIFRLRTRSTSIQTLRRAALTAQLGQFGTA
jgi:hypothetical protein